MAIASMMYAGLIFTIAIQILVSWCYLLQPRCLGLGCNLDFPFYSDPFTRFVDSDVSTATLAPPFGTATQLS